MTVIVCCLLFFYCALLLFWYRACGVVVSLDVRGTCFGAFKSKEQSGRRRTILEAAEEETKKPAYFVGARYALLPLLFLFFASFFDLPVDVIPRCHND